MESTIDYYRNKKESVYNAILVIIGGLVWLGFLYFLAKLDTADKSILPFLFMIGFYGGLFLFIFLITAVVFRANAMGNMILIGENQFPELHQMVVDGAKKLGMREAPEAYIYNSNGVFNAFATKVFGRKYLLLTSALVDANDDEQVKFVIGHELGHHAAGHLGFFYRLIKLPAYIIPFLHSAYSRQCEYTCDKLGYHVSRDLEKSSTAIQMLACGCHRLNKKMSLFAFEQQEAQVPPFWGFIAEIFRSHPRLTRRVLALKKVRLID